MKSKDSPNLYEILKSASRASAPVATAIEAHPAAEATISVGAAPADEAAPPTLQDRLAVYKAQKLAMAQSSPASPALAAPTVQVPEPAPVAPAAGPGERVLKVTYNTLVFAALVGMGLLFVAYSIGVRAGRSQAAEAATGATGAAASSAPVTAPPASPAPAPAPAPVYTINLIEWPGATAPQRLEAMRMADSLVRSLDRVGHKGAAWVSIERAGQKRVALYIGEFGSRMSEEAKSKLAAVKAVKVNGQSPFAQAAFEAKPK